MFDRVIHPRGVILWWLLGQHVAELDETLTSDGLPPTATDRALAWFIGGSARQRSSCGLLLGSLNRLKSSAATVE